jgi:hypothetical protein
MSLGWTNLEERDLTLPFMQVARILIISSCGTFVGDMPTITETEDSLEIREVMTAGRRCFFFLLALFPLLAPYELLLRPGWSSYFNFMFILALLISLGALFLSGFFVFAAVAGLSTLFRFDAKAGTLTYIHVAPIVPYRRDLIPVGVIDRIDVETHDWSDGEPSYTVHVRLRDGRSYQSASFWEQEGAIQAVQKIESFLQT